MSAYSDKVIADGAVAYWRLNEASGTTAVDVVGGKNGTISGGVTLGQAGAQADGDAAMRFNGSTGFISAPSGVLNCGPAAQSFTIECWVNGVYAEANAGVLTKGSNAFGNGGTGWTLRSRGTTNNSWEFIRNPAAATAPPRLTLAPCPTANVWSHIVVTYDASTGLATGYVNASVKGTVTWTGANAVTYTDTYPIEMGRADSFYIAAGLDEVAVYPTALTPRQIADHVAAAALPAPGTAPYAPIVLPAGKPPHGQWTPITPSDVVDSPFSALWVGGAGTVAAVSLDGRVVTFTGVQAGTRLRIAGRRVNDTATTATNLLALGGCSAHGEARPRAAQAATQAGETSGTTADLEPETAITAPDEGDPHADP